MSLNYFEHPTSAVVAENGLSLVQICDEVFKQTGNKYVVTSIIKEACSTLNKADKSAHTIKNYCTQVRNIARSDAAHQEVTDLFLTHFVMSPEVLSDVTGRAEVRRGYNSLNMVPYSTPHLYVETVQEYCYHDNKTCRLVGLLAATGRRPVELRSTYFERSDSKDTELSELGFSGQAKRRNGIGKVYNIPCLGITAPTCLNILNTDFKKFGGYQDVSAVDLNRVCAEFGEHVEWPSKVRTTPKALRAMYACMTYELFAPEKCQQWYWVNQVLGHEEHDQSTCQAYIKFKIFSDQGDAK